MDYTTIAHSVQDELVVKRSKFLTTLSPISTHSQAEQVLAKIKAEHSQATHNCYGYILLPPLDEFRFSDDKEPQNTAGKPILGVLQAKGLKGVIAVVTRYYGGIKLGTGGLAQAYRTGVERAIDASQIIKMQASYIASIQLEYAESELFINLSQPKIKILGTQYGDKVMLKFAFAKSDLEQVKAVTASITQRMEAFCLQGEQYFSY